MKAICAKARKLPKQTAELKDDLEAFEAKLDADAAEVAEEHAAARAAHKQVLIRIPQYHQAHCREPRAWLMGRCYLTDTYLSVKDTDLELHIHMTPRIAGCAKTCTSRPIV